MSHARASGRLGFTLVEGVGVLMALSTACTGSSLQSPQARAMAEMAQIAGAVESYAMEHGGLLPTDLEDLVTPDEQGYVYLKSVPLDPWGHEYVFEIEPRSGFDLISFGPDGAPGGESDAADLTLTSSDPLTQFVAFRGRRDSTTQAKADIAALAGAVEDYAMDHNGRLPENLQLLVTPDEEGYRYLSGETVPVDPWGNEYVYEPSSGQKFDLLSYGKDRSPGGEDDITLADATRSAPKR